MRTTEEIIEDIKQVIAERIQPIVEDDGGSVEFEGFEDGIVKISMNGSCQGCPSSTATLKMGIENALCHYIPEVKEVVATNVELDPEIMEMLNNR